MNPLDRPVWASLMHAPELAMGGDLAKRYRPEVHCFASAKDESRESLQAFADLIAPGQTVFVAQADPIIVPPGLQLVKQAQGVQMLATQDLTPAVDGVAVLDLGDADAEDMLALTRLTEPGPFMPRTHTMGRFIGVRENGRLVAMAGERMRFAGGTEISGVCTHPDVRGRGYGRMLSALATQHVQQRGDQAFLHAWVTNQPAIALYESLGYRTRAILQIGVLTKA